MEFTRSVQTLRRRSAINITCKETSAVWSTNVGFTNNAYGKRISVYIMLIDYNVTTETRIKMKTYTTKQINVN